MELLISKLHIEDNIENFVKVFLPHKTTAVIDTQERLDQHLFEYPVICYQKLLKCLCIKVSVHSFILQQIHSAFTRQPVFTVLLQLFHWALQLFLRFSLVQRQQIIHVFYIYILINNKKYTYLNVFFFLNIEGKFQSCLQQFYYLFKVSTTFWMCQF